MSRQRVLNEKINSNLGQNISKLFQVLLYFLFTSSKMELDYCHQKVNIQLVSRVNERLRLLRKFGDFKKIPEPLGFDGKYPVDHPKWKI